MNLRPHQKVSAMVMIAATSCSHHHTACAQESEPTPVQPTAAAQQPVQGELTFFDYLGTLIQEDEQFVDPIDVFGVNQPLNDINTNPAAPTATTSATKDSSEVQR